MDRANAPERVPWRRPITRHPLRNRETRTMEPQDNKQLALQKAISAHEQAAAALADLMPEDAAGKYGGLLAQVQGIITELKADAAGTDPGDQV